MNTDDTNAGKINPREAYDNAFNTSAKHANNTTQAQIISVINTLDAQKASTEQPKTKDEIIISKMARNLSIIMDLRENDQDEKAAKAFKQVQKMRSSLLSGDEMKSAGNARAFVKNMIVQGADGAPASGVEATYQLHKFVRENPNASPEEFATKLAQSKAVSTTQLKEREYPAPVQQDRTEYIKASKIKELQESGGYIDPKFLKPKTEKPLIDINAPPTLSPEHEANALSFAALLDAANPFTVTKETTTFNDASNKPKDPFNVPNKQAEQLLKDKGITWELE